PRREALRRHRDRSPRGRLRWVATVARELLAQPTLFARKAGRNLDVHAHEPVAQGPAAERRHSLSTQAEGRAALRRRRDLQCGPTKKRGHLDASAEGREGELDRDFAEEILPLPLEDLMLAHGEHDVEVAG